MLKTLTYSTLFPNAAQPSHGIFVENRLRHLLQSGEVATKVVAPIAWFPFADERFGHYGSLAMAPRYEERFGTPIFHPRFPLIPKIGMTVAPALLFAATRHLLGRILRGGYAFDVIDAHYFYPDGVAAALLGRLLGKPVVITARGTDINLIANYAVPRRMILWAAREAAAVITVCDALKQRLIELGAEAAKIHVLRNGVDLQLFRPLDRAAARARFGATGFTIASVGHLISRKGHDFVIEAVAKLPDACLLIAGEGPERSRLDQLVGKLGIADRVRFLGRLPHQSLSEVYSAADVLALASDREGWPNVLLEAMACGTPVVATAIWGTPEVVAAPEAGLLVHERTGAAFAAALVQLRNALPDRDATRRYAEAFSWDATTLGQLRLFRQVTGRAA
jgi:teichuronic acid biosynthesis glycosyltransferase TuaC